MMRTGNRHIAQLAQSVKVNRSVLVSLRNTNILEAFPIAGILQEVSNLLADHFRIKSVNQLRIQRPSKKVCKTVHQGDVTQSSLCTGRAFLSGPFRVLRLTLRGNIIGALYRLIAGLAENRGVRHLQHVHARVMLDTGIGCNVSQSHTHGTHLLLRIGLYGRV